MEVLRDLFEKKCREFACEPVLAVLDDLSSAANLTSLQLNGNSKRLFNKRIQYMQVFALCETLYEDTNIVSLDLSYNNLNDMAAQALSRLLKVNRTLCFLNLAGNDLTATGANHLIQALTTAGCSLQVLILSGNPLGDEGAVMLGHMLRSNSSLSVLDMSNTSAGISGIISVSAALSEVNTSLQSLDLGRPMLKGCQDTTFLSLAQMLAQNKTLVSLGLSKHCMADSNLDTLVTYGLLRNTSLKSLDLSANRLSPFSGPVIERLLNDNRQIEEIQLSHNQLGDAGALAVARCLPYTHWLQHLDLRSNGIGEQGLMALAEALSLASHVQSLFLWGNHFGPSSARAFMDTLAATGTGGLSIDLRPYEADGRAQVALLHVQ
jgi:Ran GTPase-activating protein (RanGAP) involved in mRNA processing and transport